MFLHKVILKSRLWRLFSDINFSKDYYKVLGIPKTASKAEIRKAYLNLAKTHHPDTATGNEEKFKQIGEAYEVLSDENTRKQYDAGPKKSTEYSQYSDTKSQYRKQSSYNWSNSSDQQNYQYYWYSSSKSQNSWRSNEGFYNQDWDKDKGQTFSGDWYKKQTFQNRKNYYKERKNQKRYEEQQNYNKDYDYDYRRTGKSYPSSKQIISINIWLILLSGLIIVLLYKKPRNNVDYYRNDYENQNCPYEKSSPKPNVFKDQLNLLNLNTTPKDK
ncbi:unnamed protein product [Blepharisma stoltei]|uniref:J domain-containing protein n=1 Tax=Blepharisma stoltei TaxID=1481888 RepID=A0AAU9JX92_9CILI|nr:unnamed protein product [Blepharisma stoltei]